MSSWNFRTVRNCISILTVLGVSTAAAWEIDFSRRQVDFKRVEEKSRLPASVQIETTHETQLQRVLESLEPAQDIVIMNTAKGFVPDTVHLKKGQRYRIHVVNVNQSSKNVSFIMDAFSEHHATFYGQQTSFEVNPQVEGIFSYQCPETAVQGKLVVYTMADPSLRQPASSIK